METSLSLQSRRKQAVLTIETAWLAYQDKKLYRLLKNTVRIVEMNLTHNAMLRLVPREADLFRDPAFTVKLRFRLAGDIDKTTKEALFPPMILFKIYSVSNSIRYMTGKNTISADEQGIQDSVKCMGNRTFYEHIIQDAILNHEFQGVSEPYDVTTSRDYMKYASCLDETQSSVGGKNNQWRKLSSENFSQKTIFYDVLHLACNSGTKISNRLKPYMPILTGQFQRQRTQHDHFKLMTQILLSNTEQKPAMKNFKSSFNFNKKTHGRRSTKALERSSNLRNAYMNKEETLSKSALWEQEADNLYEWTQELDELQKDFTIDWDEYLQI